MEPADAGADDRTEAGSRPRPEPIAAPAKSTVGCRTHDTAEPPHPWQLTERFAAFNVVLKAAVVVALLPLAIIRVAVFLLLSLSLVLVCAACESCRQSVVRPVAKVIGRLILVVFGVWPGLIRVNDLRKTKARVPILVVAPHVGGIDAFYFLYASFPRPIAIETYAKIPMLGAIFRAANGIAVPVAKGKKTRVMPEREADSGASALLLSHRCG